MPTTDFGPFETHLARLTAKFDKEFKAVREYRTFAPLGASFGVSEAQSWRLVTELEARLFADGRFHLSRKQSLRSGTH